MHEIGKFNHQIKKIIKKNPLFPPRSGNFPLPSLPAAPPVSLLLTCSNTLTHSRSACETHLVTPPTLPTTTTTDDGAFSYVFYSCCRRAHVFALLWLLLTWHSSRAEPWIAVCKPRPPPTLPDVCRIISWPESFHLQITRTVSFTRPPFFSFSFYVINLKMLTCPL